MLVSGGVLVSFMGNAIILADRVMTSQWEA